MNDTMKTIGLVILVAVFVGLIALGVKYADDHQITSGVIVQKCYVPVNDYFVNKEATINGKSATIPVQVHDSEKFCFVIQGKSKVSDSDQATVYIPEDMWRQANLSDYFDGLAFKVRTR